MHPAQFSASFGRAVVAIAALALCGMSGPAAPPAATPGTGVKFTVQVQGRVKSPGSIELDSGARLSDALTAAGAFAIERLIARVGGTPIPDTECTPGGSALRYVYLTRTVGSSHNTSYAIDFAALLKHDPRYDMLLQPNDKIFVPECRPWSRLILPPPTFPTPFAAS